MKLYLVLFVLCLTACNSDSKVDLLISDVDNPSEFGGESRLSANGDQLILSWVEQKEDLSSSLSMSKFQNGRFSEVIKISEGDNWFVNWADFPSVTAYAGNENHLVAHWLQKSGEGTYDYDVKISQTKDGGTTWSPPFTLHSDGIKAEHGFVSLTPAGEDRMFAVWLDGRNTKDKIHDSKTNPHSHSESMTLRSCEFDINGNVYQETELDHRVCDCCQTDVVQPEGKNPLVVYRDRSDTEVRDIFIKRKVNNKWMAPKPVWSEGWHIAGCPVNGPTIAHSDSFVAVAWYTESNETPKILLSFSNNHGSDFQKPIRIDNGNPIGRVDLVFQNGNTAWVSWIEKSESGAQLRIAKVNQDEKLEDHFVTNISEKRKSGFPILALYQDDLYLSYSEVVDENRTEIKVKKIEI